MGKKGATAPSVRQFRTPRKRTHSILALSQNRHWTNLKSGAGQGLRKWLEEEEWGGTQGPVNDLISEENTRTSQWIPVEASYINLCTSQSRGGFKSSPQKLANVSGRTENILHTAFTLPEDTWMALASSQEQANWRLWRQCVKLRTEGYDLQLHRTE